MSTFTDCFTRCHEGSQLDAKRQRCQRRRGQEISALERVEAGSSQNQHPGPRPLDRGLRSPPGPRSQPQEVASGGSGRVTRLGVSIVSRLRWTLSDAQSSEQVGGGQDHHMNPQGRAGTFRGGSCQPLCEDQGARNRRLLPLQGAPPVSPSRGDTL